MRTMRNLTKQSCNFGAPKARNFRAAPASVKLLTPVPGSVKGGLHDAAGGEATAIALEMPC